MVIDQNFWCEIERTLFWNAPWLIMIKGTPDIPGPYELTCINFEFCDNKRLVVHFIHVYIPHPLLVKSCWLKFFFLNCRNKISVFDTLQRYDYL